MTELPITARLARGNGDPAYLAAAVHESAHLLVAAGLGATAHRMEVRIDGSGEASHSPLALEGTLAALLAGEVAELELNARPGDVVVECSWNDRSRAQAIAAAEGRIEADRLLSRARSQADGLLRQHWAGLERLANCLLDAWILEGELLDSLVQAAVADAPDLVAGANAILARETAAKRREVALVERRLHFERRVAALRGQGTETAGALAAAWRDAGRHADAAAARTIPHRRVVFA